MINNDLDVACEFFVRGLVFDWRACTPFALCEAHGTLAAERLVHCYLRLSKGNHEQVWGRESGGRAVWGGRHWRGVVEEDSQVSGSPGSCTRAARSERIAHWIKRRHRCVASPNPSATLIDYVTIPRAPRSTARQSQHAPGSRPPPEQATC